MSSLKVKDCQKHAKVQDLIGLKLCETLKNLEISHFKKAFKFGCGRGEFSDKLLKIITFDEYSKNDILDYPDNLNVGVFDMDTLAIQNLSKQKFDLITSNASLQWLDLKQVLPTLASMLNKKGILLLSTFGEMNLKEIRQNTSSGLKYLSTKELGRIFRPYFSDIKITEEIVNLEFQNALEVFRHLKLSGVSSLGLYRLNKQFSKEFEERFQNKLTYHPIFILCKKDTK